MSADSKDGSTIAVRCALSDEALSAALAQAAKSVKPARAKPMKPGVYDVDVVVRIKGQIEQAAPTEANHNGFTDRELAVALLLGEGEAGRQRYLADAVRRIARAKNDDPVWSKRFAETAALLKERIGDLAERNELAETRSRAGAIKGKPTVEIIG